MGGLSGPLQSGQEDCGWVSFQFQGRGRLTHEFGQLLMGDFDQELSRLDRCEHFPAQRFFLHRFDEVLGGLEIHVRIQECFANLFQGVADIDFGDGTVSFQDFECTLKAFLQILKHRSGSRVIQRRKGRGKGTQRDVVGCENALATNSGFLPTNEVFFEPSGTFLGIAPYI